MGENPSPSGEDFSLSIFEVCKNIERPLIRVYDIKYHLVWITKYRKKILKGELAKRVRDLTREVCKVNDFNRLIGGNQIYQLVAGSSLISMLVLN